MSPADALEFASALGDLALVLTCDADGGNWTTAGATAQMEHAVRRTVPAGLSLAELLGDRVESDKLVGILQAAREDLRPLWVEFPLRQSGGPVVSLAANVAPLQDDPNTWMARFTVGGMSRERGNELRLVERRMAVLVDRIPLGVAFSDTGCRLAWMNDRCAEILGGDVSHLLGLGWLAAFSPNDQGAVRAAIMEVFADGAEANLELTIEVAGERRDVRVRLAAITETGEPGFVITFEDITVLASMGRQLAHEATHDPLTGLSNRAGFGQVLEGMLAGGIASGSLALLFCDLDDFKKVNDSLGHSAGDELLVEVAARLTASVRRSDEVARFGGDEFVICCDGLHHSSEAYDVADRIVAALRAPIELSCGTTVHVGTSVGVVIAAEDATAETLIRDADAAMYDAKHAGKGRWALSPDDETAKADRRGQLEAELTHSTGRPSPPVAPQRSRDDRESPHHDGPL